jgi:hypothetical protein
LAGYILALKEQEYLTAQGEGLGVGEGIALGEGAGVGVSIGVAVGEGEDVGDAVGVSVELGVEPGTGLAGGGKPGTGMVCCPFTLIVVIRDISTARPTRPAMMATMTSRAPSNSRFAGRFEWMYPQAANSVAVEPMRAASTPITVLIGMTCSPFPEKTHFLCFVLRQDNCNGKAISVVIIHGERE